MSLPQTPTPFDEAADLALRGAQANSSGRPADAERLLRRAIRLVDRPDASLEERVLRGRATVTLAYPTFERHGLGPALALLDDARSMVPGPEGATVRLLASIQQAGFLGRSGDWAGAVASLVAAERDSGSITPRERCSLLLNRGMARMYLHDLEGSGRDMEGSLALAVEHGYADLAFKSRHNLGCLEFLRGDLPSALRLMAEADSLDVDVARATAKLDYARVLLEAGLLDRSSVLLGEALEIASERNLRHEVGEILLDQARHAVILGKYPVARERAASAARMFRSRGAEGWRFQAEAMRIEADLAAGRRPASTARAANSLAAQAMSSPLRSSKSLCYQAALLAAESALLAGDPDSASMWLDAARPPRSLTFSAQLHDSLVRTRLSLARGEAGALRRRLRSASERMAGEQGRYASLDTRTALALHGRRLAALDLDLAIESGSPAEVFAATERWRAASQRVPAVRPPSDERLAELSTRLRQARSELRDRPSDRDTEGLRNEVARLQRAVAEHSWQQRGTTTAPVGAARPVAFGSLARAAQQHRTDVVSFFIHDKRLRALVVTARDAEVVDLGSSEAVAGVVRRIAADLTASGQALPAPLWPLVQRSLDRGLGELEALLEQAIPDEAGRLVVLPSRLLASVPWRLLPRLAGRHVVVSPSATFWTRAVASPATPARLRSPANPTDRASPTDLTTTAGLSAVAGPGLPRANDEARAVASLWPGSRSVHGAGATGAALAAALRDSRVVHVAAHGTHHEQSPLFSSVHLVDGPLFAYEFPSAGVRAEHVVLSACDVGRAVVRPGEEPLGLTASLLACGVSSVVASVAPVGDEPAERAMTAYHQALVRGLDAAEALERAADDVPEARRFCTFGASWSA